MIREQGIMVRAQVPWRVRANYDGVEHLAQGLAIDYLRLHPESNESTCELIHHHEHPMALKRHGLTSEEIHAPQTILHLTQEREPGRPITTRFWSGVFNQNSSNHVFIERDPKGPRNDQGHSGAAEAGIAAFEFHNGPNECVRRTFRPWLRSSLRREQHLIFSANEALMKF